MDWDEFWQRGEERRELRYMSGMWTDAITAIICAILIVLVVFTIVWGVMA